MNQSNACQKCGGTLAEGVEYAFCPSCLMKEAKPSAIVAETHVENSSHGPGFVAPQPAELDALIHGIEVTELIGRGGMGAVYLGRQSSLDRKVAIKVLPREAQANSQMSDRFQREAQTLGKLNHPNIVSVYDFGQADGLFYIVMEYVEGVTLREMIDAGGVGAEEALQLVPTICDALQFAHGQSVVHRDIKPENILVTKNGQVKIADFGLAKIVHGEEAHSELNLTHTHQVMGTAKYMAPEQMTTSREVDHRADIYSLGVIFYELLTGELPMGWFQPPSKKVSVDVRLDEVVLRTLEAEPQRRYQQASDVRTAIEDLQLEKNQPASSSHVLPESGQSVRLHKLVDATETKYRTRHAVSSIVGLWGFPLLTFAASVVNPDYAIHFGVGFGILALVALYYSVQVKKNLVFRTTYKGHEIVLDNSGVFAEKIYLDGGLVQTGGLGVNMEFRTKIQAGDGIGDEIVIWFTAGLLKVRCRIEAEEYL